ncbi:asparaginase [Kribbella sp. NPDC050459]|uniref:asparaginase n=1 Tax=Kribbella sp. NPDC050459 TaxID=3155785 RepID=UPI0033EE6474
MGREAGRSSSLEVIALGGTIAMTASGDAGAQPVLDAAQLTAMLPDLSDRLQVRASTFRKIPGAQLVWEDLRELRGRIDELFASGVDGVVVTQGTDTIEETAFALDLLGAAEQPIVVTGAMRHAGLLGADGPANLMDAIAVASSKHARGAGVLVVMNGEVHAARFVSKRHTARPSAFESPTCGPVGWVIEGRVRLPVRVSRRWSVDSTRDAEVPPVALVTALMGDDGRTVRALPDLGYAGAIIGGFGVGHVPVTMLDALTWLAERMPVVLASRTGAGEGGRCTYGFAGSERDLLHRGLITAGALDPLKARVLLAVALGAGLSRDAIEDAFEQLSG